MSEELKKVLISRLKSFAWRIGAYVVVAFLAWAVDTLTALQINPAIITIVAYIVGEITKFINTNVPELKGK